MARTYLEGKKFYVKNDDNFIYEVKSFDSYDGYDTLHINLELVAGWDYVNPDMNDIQGYVPADRFIEDLQSDTVIQYLLVESLKECMEANDFEIIENINSELQAIIDKKNMR